MKNFKLLAIFLTLALGVGFTSCSKDDEETILTSVVGTWQYSNVQSMLGVDYGYKETYEFKTDLTYSYVYTIVSGTSIDSPAVTGDYTYDDATKLLTLDGYDVYNVTKLTSKEMILSTDEDGPVSYKKK